MQTPVQTPIYSPDGTAITTPMGLRYSLDGMGLIIAPMNCETYLKQTPIQTPM
jgi:hypothetical protein